MPSKSIEAINHITLNRKTHTFLELGPENCQNSHPVHDMIQENCSGSESRRPILNVSIDVVGMLFLSAFNDCFQVPHFAEIIPQ
jgi:hypothetical protein